jgi:tetratricopeptide (TPR) repeat protein
MARHGGPEMTAAEPETPARGPAPTGRPTRRPQLVLVVDSGPTMEIRHEEVGRCVRDLQRSRMFRKTTVHTLRPARATTPADFPSRAAGAAVLVITDAVSANWRGGFLEPLVRVWAQRGPVALMPLLPHHGWHDAGLRTRLVELRPPRVGAPNHLLKWRPRGLAPDLPLRSYGGPPDIPVPVLESDEEWLRSWAAVVHGRPGWQALPAMFPRRAPAVREALRRAAAAPEPKAAELVASFRAAAGEEAFARATMLAAMPLTWPLLREIGAGRLPAAPLPDAPLTDVTELLVHNLVRALPTVPKRGWHDVPAFDFAPDVREELLAAGRREDLLCVVDVVGEHLGERGRPLWLLPRLLREGAADRFLAVDEFTEPWLTVQSTVLHALSGSHLVAARELDTDLDAYRSLLQRMEWRSAGDENGKSQTQQRGGSTMSEPAVEPRSVDQPRGNPTVWGNVPPRNTNFTGREELLRQLHERLHQERATAVLPHALYGMGGVGKSMLAVEYVYRRLNEYDVIWWIPAERTAQISLSLVELAPKLGLQVGADASSTVSAVMETLRVGVPYSNWLLVFDNAESPEIVRQFFPPGGPGNILITSRNQQWASIARPLEVDVFERGESIQLLQLRGPEISSEDADRLAAALGDLPLAIEQAAAWHAETGMPADEYLRLLAEKREVLLAVSAPPDYQLPVIAAWNISLDQLESKNPGALQLLQICSFCAPEPISRSFFTGVKGRPIAPELDAALADPIRLGQAIREIGRYSLAKFNHRNNSIQMHRLVQAALLSRLTEDERATMGRGTHQLLAANDPNDPNDVNNWPVYGALLPHVLVSEAVHSAEPWVRNMVVNEAIYLLRWGDYDSGLDLAATARKVWLAELGEEHPETLRISRWLGFLLFTMGRYSEAAQLNSAVLAAYQNTMGPEHQDTVDALGNVAIDRRVSGDFAGALEMSESVHQQYLRMLGTDDPETMRAAHNLGVSLRLAGDFARAEQLDGVTWHNLTQTFGEDHVDSLRTRLGLILDIRERGAYRRALTFHRQIADQCRLLLGSANPLSLSCFRHLAVALRKAGAHDEALDTIRTAQEELVKRYGEHNPESMAAALELTVNLRHAGDLDEARDRSLRIHEQYESTYGAHHPHTLSAAVNLAVTHRLSGDVPAARELNELTLGELRGGLGATHPSTLVCQTNLASDYYASGDHQRALELDERTLEISRQVMGDDHPSTLVCEANYALDLRAVGRGEEGDSVRVGTRERLAARLGANHPAVGRLADWAYRSDCDIDPMPL